MWSPVVASSSEDNPVPCARNKHATALHGPHLYLFGGRNGNMPLRDLWRYHIANNKWTRLEGLGDSPGCLQEHSIVSAGDTLYVFGGEIGFSNGLETPLWIYDIKGNSWRKYKNGKGVKAPKGRRGHTATVYQGSMYIYGGYQDLKGSISELWSYHFASNTWQLMDQKPYSDLPPPRHRHSAILHNASIWIFGGMTNLEERSDFWKWDFSTSTWSPVKSKPGPGRLHSHAAVKFLSVMLLFGGEKGGQTLNELWRFHFATEFWEKLTLMGSNNGSGSGPNPRAESTAFIFSHFQSSRGTIHYLSLSESTTEFQNNASNNTTSVTTFDFDAPPECCGLDSEDTARRDIVSDLWRDFLKPKSTQISSFSRFDDRPDNNNKKTGLQHLSRLSRPTSYSMFQNEESSLEEEDEDCEETQLTPSSFQLKEFNAKDNQLSKLDCNSIHKKSDSVFTFQSYDYSSSRCSTLSSAGSFPLKSLQNKCYESSSSDLEKFDSASVSFSNPNYTNNNEQQGTKMVEEQQKKSWSDNCSGTSSNSPEHSKTSHPQLLPPTTPTERSGESNQLILLMYILGGREIGHITAFKRPLSVWKLDLTKTF